MRSSLEFDLPRLLPLLRLTSFADFELDRFLRFGTVIAFRSFGFFFFFVVVDEEERVWSPLLPILRRNLQNPIFPDLDFDFEFL
eukprot:TRINITY_DN7957_c0_g1_i1.p1 TRINITY_DN7957_c0_g1~~TRINITY_DN7957_c0_g1_i1.p1  ORF type:complete len:84 (+),score=10.43 TRINITY_DN7957_c0_g1_i1:218-469(+)